ncbi:uncharacterized protein LOC134707625 isoform X3 [Mytilus trossulus]|uniref:uncharacterized protein LOC134707625 isoform X3 n=1 Tax=Mytilus trossulus TaxID=6551 RepID=UPI00300580E7
MLRRTARKRKAKGQEIALPRNATTRAEILTTGYQTQTSMSRPSLLLGPTSATASQQSTASADTHTVSSHTYIPDNNIPMQNAGNQFINLTPVSTSTPQMYIPQQIEGVNNDIAMNVPQNIKDKIYKSEYIDMAVLLAQNMQSDANTQKLVVKNGQIVMQSAPNLSKIFGIEVWTTAFIIFTSIYCTLHPGRFQELLKYMSVIRLGAKRCNNLGWKLYDEQFRLRKAFDPTGSWAVIDSELWLIYMNDSTESKNGSTSTNLYTASNLKCYTFNYEGSCSKQPCFYRHVCMRCGAGHAVINCHNGQTLALHNQRPTYVNPRFRSPRPQTQSRYNFSFRQPGSYPRQRPANTFMGHGAYPHKN